MESELTFKKEFEVAILKQNINEALKSLVPDSKESIYLQFCEEYNKCIDNKVLSKKLISILKKAKSLPSNLLKVLVTKKNLLEYDLHSTTQKRKNQIIDELYQNYLKILLLPKI